MVALWLWLWLCYQTVTAQEELLGEVVRFVAEICKPASSTLALQVLIACQGLPTLVNFLKQEQLCRTPANLHTNSPNEDRGGGGGRGGAEGAGGGAGAGAGAGTGAAYSPNPCDTILTSPKSPHPTSPPHLPPSPHLTRTAAILLQQQEQREVCLGRQQR